MNYFPAKRLGIFALTGSIVNDAFLFSDGGFLTWAKLLFAVGLVLTLAAGVSAERLSRAELAVISYAILLPLTTVLSNGPGVTMKSVSVIASLAMGAFTFSVFVRLGSNSSLIINSYIKWSIIGVFIGLVQAATGKLFVTERIFPSGVMEGTFRASGLMSDPNYFALTCLLGIAFGRAVKLSRIGQFILAFGVLISGSRSGILMLFALFAIDAFTYASSRKGVGLKIVGIGVFASAIFLLMAYLPDSISMIFNPASYAQDADRNSLQDRVLAISAALSAFEENPIVGYGLGNLVLHPLNIHQQVSHNSYIELLAEAGFVGFLIYCALCFYLTRSNSKTINKYVPHSVINCQHRSALISFVFFSMMSLTLVTYYSRIFFFVVAVCFLLIKKGAHE